MPTMKSRRNWIFYAPVLLAEAAYILLTLAAPKDPSQNTFGLTPVQMALIQLTIIVPYLVAWLAGTRGALDLRLCGQTIPDEEGGLGFRYLHFGIAVLVGGGLVSSILGTFRPYLAQNTDLAIIFTIANNYLYVLTELLATFFLFRGAGQLVGAGGNRTRERDDLIVTGILSVIIAALYFLLVFSNPTRQISSLPLAAAAPAAAATYYLPDIVIVLTIILPNIVAWALGLLATLRITRYAPQGRDREQILGTRRFVKGIWAIIYSSILLQLLVSIGSDRLLALGIGPILAIIYLFIIIEVIGFGLLSIGSRQLCRVTKPERGIVVTAVTPL